MIGPRFEGAVDLGKVEMRLKQEELRKKKSGPGDRGVGKVVRLGKYVVPGEAVGSSSSSECSDGFHGGDEKNVTDSLGRSANDSLVQRAHLPSPPSESGNLEDIVAMAVNKITFVEQTEVWSCCDCSEDRNPMSALACRTALCGHFRGELCCGRRWVDG